MKAAFLCLLVVCTALAVQFVDKPSPPPPGSPTAPHHEPEAVLNCTRESKDAVLCDGEKFERLEIDEAGSKLFWIHLSMSLFCVLFAGLMSGLTMGLMSLDVMHLEILQKSGSKTESARAGRIIPLVKRHHWLLVTLLLCNAAAMEALPIFLEHLVNPIIAIVVSVTAVLFFGEIIPQAICTRYGLAIGANLSWFVWGLVVVTSPLSFPISLLLDCLLGKDHTTFFRRAELKELVAIHAYAPDMQPHKHGEARHGGPLSIDEVTIIKGAIDMKTKTAIDVITNLDEVYMLPISGKLDKPTMTEIREKNHSRIPIYRFSSDHIIGMILTKTLILMDPNDETPLDDLPIHRMPTVNENTPLYTLLDIFQTGRSHMAVVNKPDNITPIGVVTLEDVIEELIQEPIEDEADNARGKPVVLTTSGTGIGHRPTIPSAIGLARSASSTTAVRRKTPRSDSTSNDKDTNDSLEPLIRLESDVEQGPGNVDDRHSVN